MTLDLALDGMASEAAWTTRCGIPTATATQSPLAGEVAARLCAIAGLRRRLAEERMALAELLGRTVAGDVNGAEASAVCHSESAGPSAGARSQDAPSVAVANGYVAEGERRLAAAGDVGENTRRTYESALRRLDAWLREHRAGATLSDAVLAEYLAFLAAHGRCVSSAAHVVAAVKRRAKRHGEAMLGERTAEALARYRRTAHAGPGQVRGVSWEEADRMRDLAASTGDLRGLRDAALIAVASDALLRVSEVSNAQVDDVAFEDDGSARLLLRRSKTDRQCRGAMLFLGPHTAALVRQWLAAASIREGALFRRIHRAGTIASQGLGAGSVRRVIVQRAAAAGIAGRVSGHSLRVGSAQSLAKRGAGLVAMQKAGRWASPDMPARYTRSQAAAEGAVACLRYRHDGAAPPIPDQAEKSA